MRQETVSVKTKSGAEKSGVVMVPETLAELVAFVGEERVYRPALKNYIALAKRRLAAGTRLRKKFVRIDLSVLTPQQRELLAILEKEIELSKTELHHGTDEIPAEVWPTEDPGV